MTTEEDKVRAHLESLITKLNIFSSKIDNVLREEKRIFRIGLNRLIISEKEKHKEKLIMMKKSMRSSSLLNLRREVAIDREKLRKIALNNK